MAGAPVLSVKGYTLDYAAPTGPFRALEEVRLAVGRGEVLGLVENRARARPR